MLPQSETESARTTAERLMTGIKNLKVPVKDGKKHFVSVTVSQGISIYPDDAKSIEELMQRADDALYKVKTTGRNNVMLYGEIAKAGNKKNTLNS
jgi:diguanylate cyclase (GGDEF)-like protein